MNFFNIKKKNNTYEVELKALLSKEKYEFLAKNLPKKMNLINKEILHTHKFISTKNQDTRLRFSNKKYELICKQGFAVDTARKEFTIKLNSKQDIINLVSLFNNLGLKKQPSWITKRMDLTYLYKNRIYNISLQDTKNFARILEVEILLRNKKEIKYHEKRIKEIILKLGCKPINKKEFAEKIKKYIKKNNSVIAKHHKNIQ